MNNSELITIDGEKFSAHDLALLIGEESIPKTPSPNILLVARALGNPLRLPWLLKDICALSPGCDEQRDLRLALIRIQVDAELRMNEDIQRYQQRRYVAQVIEVLLFNELMLAPREQAEEVEIE